MSKEYLYVSYALAALSRVLVSFFYGLVFDDWYYIWVILLLHLCDIKKVFICLLFLSCAVPVLL